MIVGLMRHFPVDFTFSKWSNSDTFNQEMDAYDKSPVRPVKSRHFHPKWDACFTSTMKRARETAALVFSGEPVPSRLLQEVPLTAGCRTRLKLPVFLWAVIGRWQWFFNSSSQPETRNQSVRRARSFLSQLFLKEGKSQNLLIVTHGFFMLSLRRELLRIGFRGPRLLQVKNGKLYQYSN